MIDKKVINSFIKMEDLLHEFGYSYVKLSGKFTHKMICPHKDHNEKTASFYINSGGNDFYCYGCGISGKPIDFYIISKNCTFVEAMSELATRIPSEYHNKKVFEKEDNYEILLKISNIMRNYLYNNLEDMEFYMKLSKKLDGIIEDMDSYDVKNAERLFLKIQKTLKEKR